MSELESIIERARTLGERFADGCHPDDAHEKNEVTDSRVKRWCQIASQGDPGAFATRLALDGLQPTTMPRLLGTTDTLNDRPLPSWVETLNECLRATVARPCVIGNDRRSLDPDQPLPFEDIFLPFIRVARLKLVELAGSRYHRLSGTAHACVERGLLRLLSHVCAPALELEFSTLRAIGRPALTRLLQPSPDGTSTDEYRAFVAKLLEGRLLDFFHEYSALVRLISTLIDCWVESAAELLIRLESDAPELQETFGIQDELGRIVAVDCRVADRHRHGRSVWILEFACGLKVVYKPRSLALDLAHSDFLIWCNQLGLPLAFKNLKVIDRSTYGWMEFVEARPSESTGEAERYYQRAGSLLCSMYVLGATDIHLENIIACGEQPVLIDLETLMQPRLCEREDHPEHEGARSIATRRIRQSVLSTGLLPYWHLGLARGIHSFDLTGLGAGNAEQKTSIRVRRWSDINTDAMKVRWELGKIPRRGDGPMPDCVEPAVDHVKAIITGFRQMHRFLRQNRAEILAPEGPLAAFAGQRVRFLLRPTMLYGFLLRRTLSPEFLREGVDRSIEFDVLSRAVLASERKHELKALLDEEIAALERFDIPVFDAITDSDTLHLGDDQAIPGLFEGTGFDRAVSRLEHLDEADLQRQIDFIRGSFACRLAEKGHDPEPLAVAEMGEPHDDAVLGPTFSPKELIATSTVIAAELADRAIRGSDGSITWIAPQYVPSARRYQFGPLGHSLYDGVAGVALFLAALNKVTPSEDLHTLTKGSLLSLRQLCQQAAVGGAENEIGIGGGAGYGSILYALTRCSKLLADPSLLDDAQNVATHLTPELISKDQNFDVLSGTAGATLGLLALHQASGSELALKRASECGHHLLNHRIATESGHRAWAIPDHKPLTGFSHGTSGIAHALLRLHEATGEEEFAQAAKEAFTYERHVFIADENNWPDLRQPQQGNERSCRCSWCHGATGIGFARLAALETLDGETLRQDLEVAIETTKRHDLTALDHLCCGNLGRADFLFTAGRRLGRPDLCEIAQRRAAWTVRRAKQRGTFGFSPPGAFNPGLFQGLAGIGYQLLRLAHPDLLPTVLLWA